MRKEKRYLCKINKGFNALLYKYYLYRINMMKLKNYLKAMLLICACTFFSCQKEEEVPTIQEYMNAQVNGKLFKASSFVVARAGVTTSMNGIFGPVSNAESIGLSIRNAKIGTFSFEEGGKDFAVYNSAVGEYISTSGTLQITSITGEWIEGNFSFVAHSINNTAGHIVISQGKFKMKFD